MFTAGSIDHLKPVAIAQQPTHHACWQGAVGHIQAGQLWQSTAAVNSLPIRHVLLLIHQLRKKYGQSRRVQAATGADVEACEAWTALGYTLQILQDNLLRSIAHAICVTLGQDCAAPSRSCMPICLGQLRRPCLASGEVCGFGAGLCYTLQMLHNILFRTKGSDCE